MNNDDRHLSELSQPVSELGSDIDVLTENKSSTNLRRKSFYAARDRHRAVVFAEAIGIMLVLLIGGTVLMKKSPGGRVSSPIGQNLSTAPAVTNPITPVDTYRQVDINGLLRANNSLVLTPTSQPVSATLGQIYFDK